MHKEKLIDPRTTVENILFDEITHLKAELKKVKIVLNKLKKCTCITSWPRARNHEERCPNALEGLPLTIQVKK